MFKVGDKVICLSRPRFNYDLKIGNVYTVLLVYTTHVCIKEICENFYHYRFKKLIDNPVNRLLYPEVDWSKYV